VITVQAVNAMKLIIVKKSTLCLVKNIIPIIKNTICAIRNGMVNNSLNTPIIIKSILYKLIR